MTYEISTVRNNTLTTALEDSKKYQELEKILDQLKSVNMKTGEVFNSEFNKLRENNDTLQALTGPSGSILDITYFNLFHSKKYKDKRSHDIINKIIELVSAKQNSVELEKEKQPQDKLEKFNKWLKDAGKVLVKKAIDNRFAHYPIETFLEQYEVEFNGLDIDTLQENEIKQLLGSLKPILDYMDKYQTDIILVNDKNKSNPDVTPSCLSDTAMVKFLQHCQKIVQKHHSLTNRTEISYNNINKDNWTTELTNLKTVIESIREPVVCAKAVVPSPKREDTPPPTSAANTTPKTVTEIEKFNQLCQKIQTNPNIDDIKNIILVFNGLNSHHQQHLSTAVNKLLSIFEGLPENNAANKDSFVKLQLIHMQYKCFYLNLPFGYSSNSITKERVQEVVNEFKRFETQLKNQMNHCDKDSQEVKDFENNEMPEFMAGYNLHKTKINRDQKHIKW